MLNEPTAQVAQLVEQGTENPFLFQELAASVVARFWSHVDRSGGVNACHPWTGARDRDGYGVFSLRRAHAVGAHRFALSLKVGRLLLPGEVARHGASCTTRLCCNDGHLISGGAADNARDRDLAGTTQKGERHYRAKLTVGQVLEIRRRCGAGERMSSVARDLGVSPNCIAHVVKGDNWKHVAEVSP